MQVSTHGPAEGSPVEPAHAASSARAEPPRHPLTWRIDGLAALGLLLFSLVFYFPLVFLGRVVVDLDAFVYFQPQRAYLAQSLLEGRIPLWNPYLFGGVPFLANPQTGIFYPPSWLFLLAPVHHAYTAQLVLHAFLAALFTYLLARMTLGARPAAAVVGALAWGFGGFIVGQVGHLNQFSAAAWLPAMVLTYDQAVRHSSVRWAGLGALVFGLQLLAGHPQESYMSALTVTIFGLVRAPWRSFSRLLWAGLAGVLVLGLGAAMAAVQLLPTLELTPLSIRGAGVNWDDAVAGSLPSYLVPRSLMPPFWLEISSTEYLGYVGVAAFALGFLALVVVRSRLVLFGGILCLMGLFLAPGENNGNYWLFWEHVPGFGTFRVPARWLFLWSFGATVLAVLGAEWALSSQRVRLLRWDLVPRMLLAALVLAAGLSWQRDAGEPLPTRRIAALWIAIGAVALSTGLLARSGALLRGRGQQIAAGLLVLLAAGELWAAGDWSPARQAPYEWAAAETGPVVSWLQDHVGDDRVLSVARPEYISLTETAGRERSQGLSEKVLVAGLVAQKWRESLMPNQPLQFRIPTLDGYDGGVLPLLRFVRMSELLIPKAQVRPDGVLQSRLESPPDPRVLDLLGVRYVLASRGTALPVGTTGWEFDDFVLIDRGPVPHSLLVFGASSAEDETALERMASSTFDSRREVLLEPGPQVVTLPPGDIGLAVQPSVRTPERWHARVEMPRDGYLLQRESWYPGWKAWVDGQPAQVHRADLLFRAVFVPAGSHEVELRFEPASYTQGLVASSAAVLVIAVMLAWPLWARLIPIIAPRGRSRRNAA